jgi:multidrug resistance efflux pump
MGFFSMDMVVKSSGVFRCEEPVNEVSSAVTGEVVTYNIKDGALVKEGDVLVTLRVESLGETIKTYQDKMSKVEERLAILEGYEKSLEGDENPMELLSENVYYQEFVNRRDLLFANIDYNKQDTKGQREVYEGNIDAISSSIKEYETKNEKFEETKKCIYSRVNVFVEEDCYYRSIVLSYISTYNLSMTQYDNQINEYQSTINAYDELLAEAKVEVLDADGNPVASEIDIDEIQEAKEKVIASINLLKNEKAQALSNLELQQISSLEQQIESIKDAILSLQTNLIAVQLQLESVENVDSSIAEDIQIMTEKRNVATEILSYQKEKEECENYLKSYEIQNDNCSIKANAAGYYYFQQEIQTGTYIQEGTTIGKIFPEKSTDYYAEIYVENSDIAKLEEKQKVKFEISAYPSNEYGYFTGEIVDISKDISVNQYTGSTYYIVKVLCDNISIKNKNGDSGTIMNGMACQAKIIIGEKKVWRIFLEKLNFLN